MNEIRNLLIGLDIDRQYSQICCYDRKAKEPISVPIKVGTTIYESPTKLCRRKEQELYCVGIEAEYFSKEKSGTLFENLFEIAGSRDMAEADGKELSPAYLLAQYIKGMLRMLGVADVIKNTRALVITLPALDDTLVDNLMEACRILGFKQGQYILLDHAESFYYYAMTLLGETWNRNVAWYSFSGNTVTFRKLTMNISKSPVLVSLLPPQQMELSETKEERDQQFMEFAKNTLGTELYSSVQLTGDGFSPDWAGQSVRFLCLMKRRVFFGNNLFAKGACACALERLENHKLKGYRYLSDTLVLTEIGMEMSIMGSPAYHPLIEAGSNWYECMAEFELILDDVSELVFIVTSLKTGKKHKVSMALPGLPVRPNRTTRLWVKLAYISAQKCQILVKDLGFGDLYPASGRSWKETTDWSGGAQ